MSKIEKNRERFVGKCFTTNNHGDCRVIAYEGKMSVTVEFNKPHCVVKCRSDNLVRGKVTNPMTPTFYNVGYMGVGDYNSSNTKHYRLWTDMLERGYSSILHKKRPAYESTTVCEEWHNFQNFAGWCDSQEFFNVKDHKGRTYHLDKDTLSSGIKEYSPNTCCFVPHEVNILLVNKGDFRNGMPTGVHFSMLKMKYKAQLSLLGKNTHLGTFTDPKEAFQAYKKAKESYVKEVANSWKGRIDDKVYDVLMKYEVVTIC